MNAKSATPLTRLPNAGLVWLEGKWSATVVTTPLGDTFEIRAVKSPVYGPGPAGGPAACWQSPTVEREPPAPPSATYRFPSGPNFSPRGVLKPVAKIDTFADCGQAEHASSK